MSGVNTRELSGTVLRPVPTAVLARAAHLPRVGRIARRGLLGRTVRVPEGLAAGMRINPGRSNPDYALGTNEPSVQDALARLVQPGTVAYDVGANVGFLTAVLARLVGPEGYVYAFEPALENAVVIRENMRRNGLGHVLVVCRAVGTTSGPQVLQVSAYSGGHALAGAEPPPDKVSSVPVEVVALDDFVRLEGVRPPDLVKIDVEGFELGVLRGMRRLLAERSPTLLVEIDDGSSAGHDRKVEEMTAFLAGFGYSLERLPPAYPAGGWIVSHWVARA